MVVVAVAAVAMGVMVVFAVSVAVNAVMAVVPSMVKAMAQSPPECTLCGTVLGDAQSRLVVNEQKQ